MTIYHIMRFRVYFLATVAMAVAFLHSSWAMAWGVSLARYYATPNPLLMTIDDFASMYPIIRPNSVVVLEKCTYNDLNVGDVIAFRIDGELAELAGVDYVLHRYMRPSPCGGLITKGDDLQDIDPFIVQPGQVVGRMVHTMAL